MPSMWIDDYFLVYRFGRAPHITFHGWATDGRLHTTHLDITEDMIFEVIKAQLDCPYVWVDWDASTNQVNRIVGIKHFE